jgi:hypothetical protein
MSLIPRPTISIKAHSVFQIWPWANLFVVFFLLLVSFITAGQSHSQTRIATWASLSDATDLGARSASPSIKKKAEDLILRLHQQ